MEKRLTDNEIIKALECCSVALMYDEEQSLYGLALDLINRLQAEIEEQGETISSLEREIEKLYYELDLRIQEKRVVEAEARKEFSERLKAKAMSRYKTIDNEYLYEFDNNFIDNLLIEMESDNA